jgi:DNA-binding MarR family transcriptional regulator
MDSPSKQRDAKPVPGVEALAGIVTGMSRFLTRIAKAAPFQQAKMGLAEWSALAAIVESSGISNKQLASALGVSGQRITQITDSLKRSGMITVGQAEHDSRKVVIAATEAGRNELAALNRKLEPLIAINNERLLPSVNLTITKKLMRLPLLQLSPEEKIARAARVAQSKQKQGAGGSDA